MTDLLYPLIPFYYKTDLLKKCGNGENGGSALFFCGFGKGIIGYFECRLLGSALFKPFFVFLPS